MGRSSSSSRKKKRDKISSKARALKSSKTKSKKRESKKLLRRISDHDDSISSMSGSFSSSSAEDSKHRRKKSRLRIKKRVVSAKKTTKKQSYSSESSDDSSPVRKRSGSKRKRNREKKKKISSKKKRRREDSVSSTEREEREEKNSENVERETRRKRYRSVSPSDNEYQVSEKVSVENNPRRLKSVICIVERDEEDTGFGRDEHKEEIVYDHDDYPSCRSNDSDNNVQHVEKDHDTLVSKFRLPEKGSDESEQANTVIELESVLRQKALENLLMFRGKSKSSGLSSVNQKSQHDGANSVENDSKVDETRTDGNSDCNESVVKPKPKLVRTPLTRQLSKPESTQIQTRLDDNGGETARSSVKNPNNGEEINEARSSAVTEPSSARSDEPKDKGNEASQFEQKSMSVMRGGEMVQVSYKVYIPKKAPALARRQLKR